MSPVSQSKRQSWGSLGWWWWHDIWALRYNLSETGSPQLDRRNPRQASPGSQGVGASAIPQGLDFRVENGQHEVNN